MSLWHRHQWRIEGQAYAPPRPELYKGTTISTYLAERVTWGVTTFVLRCSKCGRVETKEVLGEARLPVSETR
jgi:hypothetical protein